MHHKHLLIIISTFLTTNPINSMLRLRSLVMPEVIAAFPSQTQQSIPDPEADHNHGLQETIRGPIYQDNKLYANLAVTTGHMQNAE